MATKVGAIYVEIRGDDTQWKKDMAALRSAAAESGKNVSDALNSAINPSKASSGIKTISTSLTQLAQTAKVPEKQFKQTADAITDAFEDVAKSVGMTRKEFSDLNERMLRNKAFQTATNELKSLSYAAGLSVSETKKLAQQMGYTSSQAGEMANKIHRVQQESNATVDVFSRLAVAAVAAFSIHEIVDFTNKIKDAGVEVESLGFAYASITGSQSKAAKEMEYVNTTAKSLGLGLTTLEKSYKGLIAASQGTSLEGENTRKIFTSVSKASSVLGLSADQTAGALLALEQMMSKGTVQSEELRGQLGERIPGAFNKAAEAMGVTTAELSDMLKNGEVISEDFLPKFADVLERDFGKAAEDAGDQARAAFENFSTAITELKRALAESGILEYLAKVTRNATWMINEVKDAINSFNVGKMKTSVAEYDAALIKAKTNLGEFLRMYGNTRDLVPDSMKERFDDLTDAVEVLSKAKDNLSRSLQNDQDWQAYGKEAVKTFGTQVSEADKAAKDIEAALKKSYEKGTEYLLAEKKKQLAIYMQYEGRKPEYVAQLQSEIAALEKRASSSSIAEHKKATAAYKKEIDEQKQAVESFNAEHKQATLSTFDYEIDKLDEWYAEQLYLVEKGLISRQDLEETYAEKWFGLYDDDVADFVDAQQEKTDAVKKEKEEILKLEKEAYEKEQELIKASKEAYDKIYEKAYDFTRDVIEDFDNMGNTLVDLAEKMVKDIAAAFLTQTIVMPVYMYAANSLGLSSLISSGSGVSGTSSLTGTVAGAYDLYSAYGATTGGTTNTIASILGSDAVSSVGTSVFGSSWGTYGTISDVAYIIGEDGTMVSVNAGSAGASYSTGLVNSLSSAGTAGIISNLAYTYLGDMVGLPQGEYSGIGAGVGGAAGYAAGTSIASGMSSGAAAGSYYPVVGTIIGAIVGGVSSAFIGDDTPDYRLGLFPGNFDWEGSNRVATSDQYAYSIATQDYDVKNAASLFDFYDQVFAVLDEATTASINDIILNAQTGDYGRIGWFDPTESTTEENLTRMTTDVFKAIREGLVEDIGSGFSGDVFTFDFFESIQADSETLLDTYLGFRSAIETLGESEFLEQFNFQVDTLGYSAAEAYENIQTIATTIDEVSEAADALGSVETYSAIADNVDAWLLLNDTLTTVKASTEQLNRVEQARNESLGADISGLTAESIFSGITSGVDISTTIADRVTEIAVSSIAQDIYDDYISELNQEIGKVFADSDYDLNVVIDYINGIDTSEAQDAISALQKSFGLLSDDIESFNESLQDIIDENSLSDYAQSLKSINEWYYEQLETAEDLGVSIEKLNEAYGIKLDELELSRLSDELADAAGAFDDAQSDYIDALEAEIDRYEDLKDQIQDEIDAKEDLIDTNEDLLDSFQDLKDELADFQSSLITSSDNVDPAYQLSYAKAQLDATVQKLYSSDQTEVQEALGDISDVSQTYLDLSQKMNVNELDQIRALGYVQEILNTSQDIAGVQVDRTEDTISGLYDQNAILLENQEYYQTQIDLLTGIKEEVSGSTTVTIDLSTAAQNFYDALADLNTAQTNYDNADTGNATETTEDKQRSAYEALVEQTYLDVLGRAGKQAGIDYWVDSLIDTTDSVNLSNFKEAFINAAVQAGEVSSIISSKKDSYTAYVEELYWDILGRAGKQAGIDYWVGTLLDTSDNIDMSNIREAFINGAIAAGEIPKMASGGTVYGPTLSLIGEGGEAEHVTPDSQMQGVKERLDKIYEVLWTMLNLTGDKKESLEDLLDIFARNTQGSLPFKTEAA